MTTGRIAFEGVWKRFQRGPAHDSLRDLIPAMTRRLFRRGDDEAGAGGSKRDTFWALHDVSFDVGPGQCLGIIGGNGAGKSTTLKILTGILQPTRGRSVLRGRVGSLIEVSAGFHLDLTGRENVFLQGAIMGMRRDEIRRRFDEIVDFSGVSAFIDTPVKRYSSGMNARLGFSIAVHLEPDALIVDEVLSVGDASFQARAFDRLRELVKGQIPAVIVTHQLERVIQLCDSCILLDHGQVRYQGDPAETIQHYLAPDGGRAAIAPESPVGTFVIEPGWSGEVRSGERVHATLVVGLREAAVPPHMEIAFRVHALATNALMYAISLREFDTLDGGPREIRIPLTFEANLPNGNYALELELYDAPRQIVVARSAKVPLVSVAAVPFHGTSQLNARRQPGG